MNGIEIEWPEDRRAVLSFGPGLHGGLFNSSDPSVVHRVVDEIRTAAGEQVPLAFDAYLINYGDEDHPVVSFVVLCPLDSVRVPAMLWLPEHSIEGVSYQDALCMALDHFFGKYGERLAAAQGSSRPRAV